MTFTAKTQQGLLGFLLIMMLSMIHVNTVSAKLLLVQKLFATLLVILIFSVRYEFTLNDNILIYRVIIAKVPVYTKTIQSSDITKVTFEKVGLDNRGAFIHLKKGFKIRILGFSPEDIFGELTVFANEHQVESIKTKEFLRLEERELTKI